MGLAGRSILARADTGYARCGRAHWIGLLGVTQPQPSGQFPTVGRAQFQRLLYHYFLRLRRALRCQHFFARLTSSVVWVQRLKRGAGHVAVRVLRPPCDAGRWLHARPKDRCSMVDRRGIATDGRQQLLDVADEPLYQSGPGCLASGRFGLRTIDMFCTRKRGRLSLYADCTTWSGCRLIESSAQRGRQRWSVDGPDAARKARSIPYTAARRVPRSL